jgi:hypothetical protein
MAQSRRSSAHVSGRAAAPVPVSARPGRGGLGAVLRSHHPAAGEIPFGHLCQPIWAAAVEVSAPACPLDGEAAPARPAMAQAGPGGKAM